MKTNKGVVKIVLQFKMSYKTSSLGGNKVNMLTHAHPHKPQGKIKVVICNHDSSFYLWPDVCSAGDFHVKKKSIAILDTECPFLD